MEVIAKIDRWTDRKRVFLLLRSLDRELDFFQPTQKGGGGAVQFHAPILHFVFWEASAQQLSRGRSPPTRVPPERGVCVCVCTFYLPQFSTFFPAHDLIAFARLRKELPSVPAGPSSKKGGRGSNSGKQRCK